MQVSTNHSAFLPHRETSVQCADADTTAQIALSVFLGIAFAVGIYLHKKKLRFAVLPGRIQIPAPLRNIPVRIQDRTAQENDQQKLLKRRLNQRSHNVEYARRIKKR